MIDYVINITTVDSDAKDSVATAVYRFTANAALQRNDAQAVATEDNEAMVNVFIEDGKKLLEKALGRYSTGALAYSMPDTWPDRHEEVDSYADTFLKNYALAKWYELNGTGERFINAANEALENIVTILGKRTKPDR
jgi:hypothetical protein